MTFLETSPSITKDEIEQIGRQLGIIFPNEFVIHYLKYNGGYPEGDTYNWANGDTNTVNSFHSLKYEGFGKVEDAYENLVLDEKYLPLGLVIFATDDGGNFFCVSTRENDYGKVYYCNNDHYSVTNPEEALTLLEDTFADFIDHLS